MSSPALEHCAVGQRPLRGGGPFHYAPLSQTANEIRLLHVFSGAYEDPIECSLSLVRLTKALRYETISYCWNNPLLEETIYVNGYQLDIPASSAAAIRRMRLEVLTRTLWIDAVCIDQLNTRERGSQVALMGEIFHTAVGNLIDLGERDETTNCAIAAIGKIQEDFAREVATLSGDSGQRRILLKRFRETQAAFVSEAVLRVALDWEALAVFFARPWFSRLWVFQEAALARSNRCFVGSTELSLLQIVEVACWVKNKRLHLPHNLTSTAGVQNGPSLWDFIDPENGIYCGQREPRASLATLLHMQQRGLLASEPRDRVFGLLGLTSFANSIPMELNPDYNKAIPHVFRDATRVALRERGPHRVLLFVSHRSKEDLEQQDWPSWVPRWCRNFDSQRDPERLFRIPATDRVPSSTISGHEGLLTLPGVRIDEVAHFTPTFVDGEPLGVRAWLDEVRKVVGIEDIAACSTSTILTLMGGRNAERQPASILDAAQFNEFFRSLGLDCSTDSWKPSQTDGVAGQISADASRFSRAFRVASTFRRFFKTTMGYVGIGPGIMRRGDVVVAFRSNCVPEPYIPPKSFVLRLSENQCHQQMIGHCYLQEIMEMRLDYEAVQDHVIASRPEEVFTLR